MGQVSGCDCPPPMNDPQELHDSRNKPEPNQIHTVDRSGISEVSGGFSSSNPHFQWGDIPWGGIEELFGSEYFIAFL